MRREPCNWGSRPQEVRGRNLNLEWRSRQGVFSVPAHSLRTGSSFPCGRSPFLVGSLQVVGLSASSVQIQSFRFDAEVAVFVVLLGPMPIVTGRLKVLERGVATLLLSQLDAWVRRAPRMQASDVEWVFRVKGDRQHLRKHLAVHHFTQPTRFLPRHTGLARVDDGHGVGLRGLETPDLSHHERARQLPYSESRLAPR